MEIIISVIGLLLAVILATYTYTHYRVSNNKIKHDIFTYYNKRYDEINNDLNKIVEKKEKVLSIDEKEDIKDYLNLCAEEYFWRKRKLIYDDVWDNWVSGMCYFFVNDLIKQVIKEEEKNKDSYYGFFEIINKICNKNDGKNEK